MNPWASSSALTAPVAAISQVPSSNKIDGSNVNVNVNVAAARQITLTQTLTNGGAISTAIVTLDRGTPPAEATPPPDQESLNSGGMPPQAIGIIVGCSVGVVVLILVIAYCCIAMRRCAIREVDDGDGSDMSQMPSAHAETEPWEFPWSRPPPTLRPGQYPDYHATVPPQLYTAHDPAEDRTGY